MKQQILNLKKKLLIIEFSDGDSIKVMNLYKQEGKGIFSEAGLLKGIRVIKGMGKLTDITEEQFKEWVEKNYPHYVFNEGKFKINCKTAKESFFSYLEKEGIYFSNPLDWEKKAYLFKGSEDSWGHDDLKRWQEAEEKVWNLNSCYIFEII